ncbi:MAG: hypothetical protein QM504_18550 [Pseudomonadota bacterium]
MVRINFIFKILINLLILSIVIFAFYDYINYKHHYNEKSKNIVEQTVNDILKLNSNLRTQISHLMIENQDVLIKLYNDPEDIQLIEQLKTTFKKQLPSFYTFTLADQHGNLVTDVFFEKVGRLCRQDIKQYALHESNTWLTIHPGMEQYHFDIIVPLHFGDTKQIMFISFYIDGLVNILKQNDRPSHELFIVRKDKNNLIELSSSGSRADQNNAFFLTDKQLQGYSSNIAGTYWTVIELPSTSFFKYYLHDTLYNRIANFSLKDVFQ